MTAKTNNVLKLQFSYKIHDYQEFEKKMYCPDGWLVRKVVALPFSAIGGIIKTIYRIARGILIDFPRVLFGNVKPLKATVFSLARDFQESYGWIVTLFNDKRGRYIRHNSRVQKELYDCAFSSKKLYNFLEKTISSGDKTTLEALINNGAKIDQRNSDKETALLKALESKHEDIAMLLIEKGADVNVQGKRGENTPLILAAEHGFKNVVEQLFKKGAKIDQRNSSKKTALLKALEKKHEDIAMLLIEKGADVHVQGNWREDTPLILAAGHGFKNVVEQLLKKGAKIDQRNSYEETALFKALDCEHEDIAMLLIEKGADVNVQEKWFGGTPLILAAEHGFKNVMEQLLKKGAKIDQRNSDKKTALLKALESKHEDTAMLLIENGADVNDQGNWGENTLLILAAQHGFKNVVEQLVIKGIDLFKPANNGSHAMHFAAQEGQLEIVKLFLKKGFNIDSMGLKNRTALFFAVGAGKEKVVEYLLQKGANPNIIDENQITPLELAKDEGNQKIIDLLRKEKLGDKTEKTM